MIIWLDHAIFGNGYGLGSPLFDSRFYWLVNSHNLKGELYTFSPGYGAQLTSVQWRHPRASERRFLCNREFKPFHSRRLWGRVIVSWALTQLPSNIDEANEELRALREKLGTAA